MLELEHEFRVVDVNARLEPDVERRPREGIGGPERLEREMHQAGIVRSVVYPPGRDRDYLKANNAVARMSVGRPLVPLARITGALDPGTGPGSKLKNLTASRSEDHADPEDIEQYAYDDRFAGFVVHPARDGLPDDEVLATLADVELPVLVHAGEGFPPDALAKTLLAEDITTIVASFGGYPLDRAMMEQTIDLLEDWDQCYLDTSFVRFREPLERALMEHPDRVLFGSGAPGAHPNVAIMEILTLDVPQDAMRKAFSNNAGRVLEELAPRSF
ncbi:amidohydrolase family protein [Halapricum hydrolyticum]|uniref:Amidohydrolase family protein n=1 Tax=Halapricum hydrolyticum TaxID=2979991 RepID=A0AAE3LJW2_9EURY|nr:amidohydrolase family protein [Halapricum hydrolyticum]MCU4718819.1 amidohydrolase family protein [Halapricum hydrolyticum]MCU4727773.1 amidohydrolase family protein [Halapricum hydrolyticum]